MTGGLTALYFSLARRIFIVRLRGKTAGMLLAFQSFNAQHGGKNTSDKLIYNAGTPLIYYALPH